jgi:regulatory protein
MQPSPTLDGPAGDTPPTAERASIERALIEKWAFFYLERYASSAENLRRVLLRRVRRRAKTDGVADGEAMGAAGAIIDALIARYRAAGIIDDGAYAAGRARGRLARGHPLRRIAAGLAAKGVGAADTAAALAALREGAVDPDLTAACAFARRRRLGPFRRTPAGQGEGGSTDRQRELAAFAGAGFERCHAEAVLACANEAAITALLGRADL